MRQIRLKEAVETCVNVNHSLCVELQGGRQQEEVILFEGRYYLEASLHIVRSLEMGGKCAGQRGENTL